MGAIRFATTAESPNSMTLTFAMNPSLPRAIPVAAPARITYPAGDGTIYQEEVGLLADLDLRWTDATPMDPDDFASLLTFWRYVRGTQDRFTYRDEGGVDHDAHFMAPLDNVEEHQGGFVLTLAVRIRT